MNREKENSLIDPLKRRASTLSLNLRRASASSFRSMTPAGAPAGVAMVSPRPGSMARLRDSFLVPRARPSTSNLISLPTPVNDSREKFQSKLRAQRSLLSLTGDEDGYAAQQRALLEELLSLCGQSAVEAEDPQAAQQAAAGLTMRTDFGPSGAPLDQVVRTLSAYKCAPAGFVQTAGARVEGADPDLCLLHTLDDAGVPLPEFTLSSWTDAYLIFWQVVSSLSVAERRLQFEHRDLRPETILIRRNAFTQRTEATIGGLEYCRLRLPEGAPDSASGGSIACTRLDSPHFFVGDQRNRNVYRAMQQLLMDASPDKTNPQWDAFMPRTNVLWLHALAEYLLASVQGPDHPLRKSLQQTERRLRPKKRSILGSRELDSACEVAEWGERLRKH